MSFNEYLSAGSRYLLAGAAGLAISCGGGAEHAKKAEQKAAAPVRVTTAPVTETESAETIEVTGTVRARAVSPLAARVLATVLEVRVQVGDRVAAGQALVVLDDRDLRAQVERAEAAVAEAKSGIPEAEQAIAGASAQRDLSQATLKRMRDLLDKKSVSQQEFDEAAARARVADSGVEMARARRKQLDEKIRQAERAVEAVKVQRGFTTIAAPFAGRVTARMAEPGMTAAPGVPLLEVEQAAGYRLEAAVEESQLRHVRQGSRAAVTIDALGAEFEAPVVEIVPQVNAMSRAFIAKLEMPAREGMQSGLFGRARFAIGSRKALTVGARAVRREGELEYVFVVNGGKAEKRLVRLGPLSGGRAEVLSGVAAGERVVEPAIESLEDGAPVEAN